MSGSSSSYAGVSNSAASLSRKETDGIVTRSNSYDTALRQLREMGFTDDARNREVLATTNGDVKAATEILCRLPSNTVSSAHGRTASASDDDKAIQLWNMGFHDEAKNRDALRRTGGNVEVAAALLVEERSTAKRTIEQPASASSQAVGSLQQEQQRKQHKLPLSQSSSILDMSPSELMPTQKTQFTDVNTYSPNAYSSLNGSQVNQAFG